MVFIVEEGVVIDYFLYYGPKPVGKLRLDLHTNPDMAALKKMAALNLLCFCVTFSIPFLMSCHNLM